MDATTNIDIAHQIARGEEIVSAATFVGDLDDLDLWRRKRATWANDVANVLRDRVDAATLNAFERTVRQPATTGNIHEDLPHEVQSVRESIELLRSLGDVRVEL